MNRPRWLGRRSTGTSLEVIDRPSDEAFKASVGAFAKAVYQEDGQLLKAFLDGNAAKMPGTSWSNQGTVNNALIARVTQNLASSFQRAPEELEAALAEHGLSWGPPFPPGRPLDPFWGYRRPPRTWNFSVGENVQLTPRWNRIAFPTLKAIIESYYAAQICVRHLINDVRSLDYQFIPPQNVMEDATEDLVKAEEFFASPDKRQPFRAWLAEYLQDVLRYDAGALYIRRNQADEPIALEVVSGATIIPLIDFFGRPPADEDDSNAIPEGIWEGDVTPAYTQIIEGMPWVWLAEDDLIYQPLNPLPESQYGLAPMEAVLLQANTDIRFQWHFLQYFTEGSIPAGFMEAPPDLSDPAQVTEWQEAWDAVMLGDQSKLRQVRWVPAGAKFTAVKNGDFDDAFPLYLMRCTAAAFGVTPNDLGFTEDVNRSTGETQVNIQFRVGTMPIVRHVEDVINMFILEHLHLKARIAFDTGQGTQHRLEIAQADDIDIQNGTMSTDERRIKLGYRISRERPTARYINNTRAGPIPLLGLESLAGKIDPTTYGPDKDQKLPDHPFVSAPGVGPVPNSQEYKDAQDATANMQRNMVIENGHPQAAGGIRRTVEIQDTPSKPVGPPEPDAPVTQKELYETIDMLLDRIEKDAVGPSAPDNTGGPGVTRGFSGPTEGIEVSTGVQGSDHKGDKKRPDKENPQVDDEVEKSLILIKQWRKNAIHRVKKGQTPRRFEDIPPFIADPIWFRLCAAETVPQVVKAFEGDFLASPKVEARKGLNREAAGIAVQAADTGRVLMIQRTPDKHDDDDTFARWEWPGGKLDGGHEGGEDPSVWAGALREWSEETGATMPDGVEPCGGWISDDECYEGFVVRIPREADVQLAPQAEEATAAKWWSPDDLEDHTVREKVHEQLDSIQPILKTKWEDYHRNTDKIVDHYSPLVRDTLAGAVSAEGVTAAIRAAYTAKKGLPEGPGSHKKPKYLSLQAITNKIQAVPNALRGLGSLLQRIYAEAVREVASEMRGLLPGSQPVEDWQPTGEDIAALLEEGGLQALLADADVVIRGITDTQIERIGNAIAEGVEAGLSEEETVAKVDAIVHDLNRAVMIAETEFNRALTAARRTAYRKSGVVMVRWIHQPGACPRCLENAAVSPISITQSWPSGDVPVHPWCRCVEAPYVTGSPQ